MYDGNATKHNILAVFDDLSNKLKADDRVVVFIASHGSSKTVGTAKFSYRCADCRRGKDEHAPADHEFKLDESLPKWRGWHAARRGLGTNLYRLGVPEKTIQAILRHANVSTTATYYIKTSAADTQAAMGKLESELIGQRTGNDGETRSESVDLKTTPN